MPPSSADALKSLTDYNTNRQGAQSIQDQANSQYDLPGYNSRLSTIRGLVGNLQSSVDAVDPSVTGRTSGSFVTEGQRSALVNKEQAPILGNLAKENTALSNEQAGQQNAQSLASQMASAMMSQDQTKYQGLLDQYNAAVAAEAAAEQKRQYEQSRQDALAKAASDRAAAAATTGYSVGGGNTAPASGAGPLTGGKTTDQAKIAIQSLLATNSPVTIANTINAIYKSAGYGNTYDQAKLELLRKTQPGLFNSNGTPKAVGAPLTLGGLGAGTKLTSSKGLTF